MDSLDVQGLDVMGRTKVNVLGLLSDRGKHACEHSHFFFYTSHEAIRMSDHVCTIFLQIFCGKDIAHHRKKTLAKTANCIPQGLRKGSPFKDLLCNSHISFAVKTFHFYKQVKKDAVKIILKKRYKCITHPPLGSQFGHPHWSPRGTFRVAVRQVVLCKAHRIHRMGFYTLHIHLATVLSWYTDKSW